MLYINLEGENGASSCSVPWQRQGADGQRDWLISGAELAIGGDYRYTTGPCGGPEEDEQLVRDEDEDDVVINV